MLTQVIIVFYKLVLKNQAATVSGTTTLSFLWCDELGYLVPEWSDDTVAYCIIRHVMLLYLDTIDPRISGPKVKNVDKKFIQAQ